MPSVVYASSSAIMSSAAPSPPPSRRLRVLCLHSFRTSGAIFREQLRRAGLLDALAPLADLHFVDAPNPASGPVPDDVAPFFAGPYFEWWNASRRADGSWRYEFSDRSLAFLERVMAEAGPFDGALGFSQGGAAACLLAALQRRAAAGEQKLRFAAAFAGIRVRDPRLDAAFAALDGLPSLHVVGDRDPVKRLTNDLIAAFRDPPPVVISHARGHVVPPLAGDDLRRFLAFFEGFLERDGGGQAAAAVAGAAELPPGARL